MTLDFSNKAQILSLLKNQFSNGTWENDIFSFLNWYYNSSSPLHQETSGSTGNPKLISLSRNVLTQSAEATINYFSIPEKSKVLLCIPAKYIGGKMMILRAIIGKWKLTCLEPKIHLSEQLGELGKFQFSAMIPAQASSILEIDEKLLRNIKTLILGGAAVSQGLEKALCNAKINAYSTYGMTETASHVALKKLDLHSNFKALDGVTFSVDSDNRLIIEGKRIPESPLLTNDVVNLDNDSSFSWLGRFDNMINSGGVKIQGEELEKLIANLLEKPFYIKKSSHPTLGQTPVLVLEDDEWNMKEIENLLQRIKKLVPKYWTPTEVEFRKPFLHTDSGKIRRI